MKWEYRYEHAATLKEDGMNFLGEDGWELVLFHDIYFVFKRAVTPLIH